MGRCFYWRGKTDLAFVSNKIGPAKNCRMLDELYQPYVGKVFPNGDVFQQDGAPVDTALHTKDYFMKIY